MKEKNPPRKRDKGGRPPKNDLAAHRLTVNLNDVQHAEFLSMFERSGVATQSAFIAARIFGDEFRVVTTDAMAFCTAHWPTTSRKSMRKRARFWSVIW